MDDARHPCDHPKRRLEKALHTTDQLAANLRRYAAQGPPNTPKGPGKDPDDYSDSLYYRAVRTRIGRALRSVPTEPAPERVLKAIEPLDRATDGGGDPAEGSAKR